MRDFSKSLKVGNLGWDINKLNHSKAHAEDSVKQTGGKSAYWNKQLELIEEAIRALHNKDEKEFKRLTSQIKI